jgi:aldehyde dehydrogenase (NAD+)
LEAFNHPKNKKMNFVADTVSTEQIEKVFLAQKANQYTVANEPIKARKAKLKSLLNALEITYRQEIRDALMADFKKPQADVDLSEIFPVTSEIKHTISHLSKWT